jgi:hypothetical protein
MIKKLFALLGLMAGVNVACDVNESNVDDSDDKNGVVQTVNNLETLVVDITDAKDNRVAEYGDYNIIAKPAQAGRSTNVFAFADLSNKNKIKKVELYKNGDLIESVEGGHLDLDIESDAGLHSFVAKFYDEGGREVLSKPIEVNFSGEGIDFKPIISDFNLKKDAGNSTYMYVNLDDIGDNKGLKEVRFYENDELIKTFEGSKSVNMAVSSDKEESRVYKLEVEDILGNITVSDEIEVSFSGKPNKPNLKLFSTSPNDAGVNGFISAYVNDKDNFVNDGIDEVILFENGEEVERKKVNSKRRSSDSSVHFYVKDRNEGTNDYFIRAINKQGEFVDSKVEAINFSGEYFAPEITWFDSSRNVGKTASVFVNAKDGRNIVDSKVTKIELYEDGVLVHESDSDRLFFEVTKDDAQKVEYTARVTNHYGVQTLSDKLEVEFKGQDNSANIDHFNVYVDQESGVSKVFVKANDKSNVRDGYGISEIILFEDGKIISRSDGSNNLFTDLSSREGKHEYRIEVINNFGVSAFQEIEFDYSKKDKL